MMKKTCVRVFIFCLFTANLFAEPENIKAIKELEQMERKAPVERIARPSAAYRAGNLRDPFRKPESLSKEKPGASLSEVTAEKRLPALEVQGLIWGGRLPQAIINNKVLKIGDIIEGVQITSIDKDGVSVSLEGIEHRLSSPAANYKPQKNLNTQP